jgi:hypothetical protein
VTAQQQKVLTALEAGDTVTQACTAAGILRTEFYAWIKDDKPFREVIAHSDLADIMTIEDVLFVKALSGSVADRRLYLERREEGKRGGQLDAIDEDIANLREQLRHPKS